MDRIRWAVMGAGGIARRRTIPEGMVPSKNAELVAVYSPHSGRDVADQFGVVAAASEEELFDIEFDALYIASPVDCHHRQVLWGAHAKRHVLCEKPLAVNVVEAAAMVEACESAGVLFGTAFMMKMHPYHQKMADLVRSGAIGCPVYARAQLACWYPRMENAWRQDRKRSGGGVLPDLASHCIDLLEMVLDDRVAATSCGAGSIVHNYAVEDTAVLLLEFERGGYATVDCFFNVPDACATNRLEIYGSNGSLLAENTLGQTAGGTLQIRCGEAGDFRIDSADLMPLRLKTNLYQAQIEAFSEAILKQAPPPVSGRQGLRIQQILADCYSSLAQRRPCILTHS